MSKSYRWRMWCRQYILWLRVRKQIMNRKARVHVWRLDANPKYGPRSGLTLRERYERGLKYGLEMIPHFSQREIELYLNAKYPSL